MLFNLIGLSPLSLAAKLNFNNQKKSILASLIEEQAIRYSRGHN